MKLLLRSTKDSVDVCLVELQQSQLFMMQPAWLSTLKKGCRRKDNYLEMGIASS